MPDSIDSNIWLLFECRLWHQISDELVAYFKEKAFDQGENSDLLTLYESLVKGLTHKLNPIKYAILTVLASRQHADIELSIQFLEEAKVRLENYKDAVYLCRIAQAEKKLTLGEHHDCIQILGEVQQQVQADSDIDPKVYATMNEVFSNYYRRKEDQENFYKASLQFLAYTPSTELTSE